MMIATKKHQHHVDSLKGIDPRLIVPLCIRENQLEGDVLLPDSPNAAKGASIDPRILSSPTSIMEVIDRLPEGGMGGDKKAKMSQKKKRRTKGKLFRSRRKSSREEELASAALRRQAELLKHTQEEEDADFAKLRAEEEESPKLDMLVHYPLTIMEEVLRIPAQVPSSYDTDEDESDDKEREIFVQPPQSSDNPEEKVLDLGRYKEKVCALRVSQMELRRLVSQKVKFQNLQQELRDRGAITDETLRQQLYIFCRTKAEEEDGEIIEFRDIFSDLSHRGEKGWNINLPLAYRRMNALSTEIDWRQSIENDPSMLAPSSPSCTKGKKKWSDRKEVEESENLQEGVDLLTYCVHDLLPIVEEHEVFTNLQKELRKIGAVTNEVLKQGLHFYVRDVKVQKEREEAAMRTTEEKSFSEAIQGQRHGDVAGPAKRRPLLKKLRFRSKRNI